MVLIRAEAASDREVVRALTLAAFEGETEADLIDAVRGAGGYLRSFVAEEAGIVLGHILFTEVTVDGQAVVGAGLGPMAVRPGHQQRGIGSALVRHGLAELRHEGCGFVVVLGHAAYYPRFGFVPASRYGLRCQWEGVPDDVFLATAFQPSMLPPGGGVVRYRTEFEA